jgi:iron complex transport system ATP-binding protein
MTPASCTPPPCPTLGPTLLAARGLTVGHAAAGQHTEVLADLALDLHRGELVCLLGRNGSGKSTLLRTLAGLLPALAGQVLLGGREIARLAGRERARQLAIVMQTSAPFGPVTAWEIVALGRYPHTAWNARLSEHDRQAVVRALDAVGARPLAERAVATLSDGERQKIMIARALAQESPIMLLDEPTAFLDLTARAELMLNLVRLVHPRGAEQPDIGQPDIDLPDAAARAFVVSTHDLDLALRCADRLWLVHDGQLIAGPPERMLADGTLGRAFGQEVVTSRFGSGEQYNSTLV